MNTYQIIKNSNLIVHYLSGDVTASLIIEQMKRISLEQDYSIYYDVITDLRDSNVKTEIQEIGGFVDFVTNDLKIVAKRKVIYLTSKPYEVVLTTLLSDVIKNSEINIYVCSTIDSAVNFIDNADINKQSLNDLINGMKTNSLTTAHK